MGALRSLPVVRVGGDRSITSLIRPPMHRHRIATFGERFAVPGGPPRHRLEASRLREPVVLLERHTIRPDPKAGHEEAPRDKVRTEFVQNAPFAPWIEEDHHVPSQNYNVELDLDTRREIGEIGLDPSEFWTLGARRGEHPGVGIHANYREPALRQLDRHPSSSAAGVKYAGSTRLAKQCLDQVRFAVNVMARSG